jgi:hypothetical protein
MLRILSRLDIDSLKIQKEASKFLQDQKTAASVISNKPMHTALIFKEQAKVKGLKERA